MNSLTRICQAVTPGRRHGRSRCARSYQVEQLTRIDGQLWLRAECRQCPTRTRYLHGRHSARVTSASSPATPDHPSQSIEHRARLAEGQKPTAVVFGCADSRVAAEIIFDQGLGDMFVVRTAGHVAGLRPYSDRSNTR